MVAASDATTQTDSASCWISSSSSTGDTTTQTDSAPVGLGPASSDGIGQSDSNTASNVGPVTFAVEGGSPFVGYSTGPGTSPSVAVTTAGASKLIAIVISGASAQPATPTLGASGGTGSGNVGAWSNPVAVIGTTNRFAWIFEADSTGALVGVTIGAAGPWANADSSIHVYSVTGANASQAGRATLSATAATGTPQGTLNSAAGSIALWGGIGGSAITPVTGNEVGLDAAYTGDEYFSGRWTGLTAGSVLVGSSASTTSEWTLVGIEVLPAAGGSTQTSSTTDGTTLTDSNTASVATPGSSANTDGTTQSDANTVRLTSVVVDSTTQTDNAFGGAPIFPLALSTNGRYLKDASGNPWRIKADAAWFLSSMASPSQVDTYLANRAAKGFNAFFLMAMVHPTGYGAVDSFHGNTTNAYDYAGNVAFTTPNDFSTPGTAYWANLDSIITKAYNAGIAVCLFPYYLGYGGGVQGWESIVGAMSGAQATAFGTWLGNRYKTFTNILWMAGGDHHPTGTALTNVNLIDAAIRAAGAAQLWGAEFNGHNDVPSIDDADVTGVDMDSYYGYGPNGNYNVYYDADRAYIAGARPVWAQETCYEYEDNTGDRGSQNSQWFCRRSHFWNNLAGGIAGYGFGTANVYLMSWGTPAVALDSPGSVQTGYAHGLFNTIPWWDLRPSGTGTGKAGKTLITSGAGTWGVSNVDTVTSAVTGDGGWLLAYIPGTNNGTATSAITVDMTAMGGTTRARWWNPVTGAYTAIGTGYANTGTRAYTTPGSNGDGNDWVLVLDAAPATSSATNDTTTASDSTLVVLGAGQIDSVTQTATSAVAQGSASTDGATQADSNAATVGISIGLVDATSQADSSPAAQTAPQTDGSSQADQTSIGVLASEVDGVSQSDISTATQTAALGDGATQIDSVLVSVLSATSDLAVGSDSSQTQTGTSSGDVTSQSDSTGVAQVQASVVVDGTTQVDSGNVTQALTSSVSDSTSQVDLNSATVGIVSNIVDASSQSDQLTAACGAAQADISAQSDATTIGLWAAESDGTSQADTQLTVPVAIHVDGVTQSDSSSTSITGLESDGTSQADSTSATQTSPVSDATAGADSSTVRVVSALLDTSTQTDASAATSVTSSADGTSQTDASALRTAATQSDNTYSSDSNAAWQTAGESDTCFTPDSTSVTLSATHSDSTASGDAVVSGVGAISSTGDASSALDSSAILVGAPNLDSTVTSDVSAIFLVARTPDAVASADVVSAVPTATQTDTTGAGDSTAVTVKPLSADQTTSTESVSVTTVTVSGSVDSSSSADSSGVAQTSRTSEVSASTDSGFAGQGYLTLSTDGTAVTDSVQTTEGYVHSVSDSVASSDSIATSRNLQHSDGVTATDGVIVQFVYGIPGQLPVPFHFMSVGDVFTWAVMGDGGPYQVTFDVEVGVDSVFEIWDGATLLATIYVSGGGGDSFDPPFDVLLG
jgi:hypothetical protein